DDLQKNGFDLKFKMGTVLKDYRKNLVSFRALDDITTAYRLAFCQQGKAILGILTAPQLKYAAAVRNLLIHKRGIIDGQFIEQCAGIPDIPQLKENERLPITGKLCAILSDACHYSSIELILAVHGWIVGHPDSYAGGAS